MSSSLELKIQEVFEVISEKGEHDPIAVTLQIMVWDSSDTPYLYYAELRVPTFTNVRGGAATKVIAGDGSHGYTIENCIDVLLAELKGEEK